MQRLFVLLFFFSILHASGQQPDSALFKMAAAKVQKIYAPDKRVVYFATHFKGDSIFVESSSADAIAAMDKELGTLQGIKIAKVLLPSPSLNGMEYGVANLSVTNNRANPQNAAEMVTQMLLGTPVEILKKQGGYYLVRTPDGYLSYTDGSALAPMDKTAFERWKKADKVVFTADYGNAFASAQYSASRVSDLVNGDILKLVAREGDFFKVEFPDRRTGFVPVSQAALYSRWTKRKDPTAEGILATAQKFVGIPYLWGGTSVKGMDCSGFTKTAYFLNGIILPRDASQQALVGAPVDVLENDSISVALCLKNLLPGDLLFFSAAKRRGINGGRVTHTAIYMGNGKFIQAAGMVKINSLVPGTEDYDGPQSSTLVGAQRLLTAIGQPGITRIDAHPWYK